MNNLEEKIKDAILKEIGNEDEGGFTLEMDEGDAHYFIECGFVTEGHRVGRDYFHEGYWDVTYAKVDVDIEAYDPEGNKLPTNCSERAIADEVERCLYN